MPNPTTTAFQSLLDLISGFDLAKKQEALSIIDQFVFPGGQPAGQPGIDAAIEALASGGFFNALAPSATVNDVDSGGLQTGGGLENQGLFGAQPDTPIAMGVDLQQLQFENLLSSREDRRATIDQQVSIALFLAEVARASPTRAASINATLGLGQNIDFGFANAFVGGGQLSPGQGGFSTGTVGGQNVTLPNSLNLNQLSFLDANPMIARFVQDLGDFLGKPDIFSTSIAGAIPTSSVLAGQAA